MVWLMILAAEYAFMLAVYLDQRRRDRILARAVARMLTEPIANTRPPTMTLLPPEWLDRSDPDG